MKKVVISFITFLLVSVSLGNVISNTVIYLKANETTVNNNSSKTNGDEITTINESESSKESNDESAISEDNVDSTNTMNPDQSTDTSKQSVDIAPLALITLSGDSTYQAGPAQTSDQILADAKINLAGIRLNAGLDLSGVNFGVPGTYTATALGVNALGISVAEIVVKVHIIDTIAPVITGNSNISFPRGTTISNTAFLSAINVVVQDNASATVTPQVDLSQVKFDTAGTYVAVVTAKDASGNNATPFNVNVAIGDVIPPVITGDKTISYTKGISRTATEFLTDIHVAVTDNSGETIVPSVDLSTVNFNQVGVYTVNVNAKDSSGNNALPYSVTITIVAAPSNLITAKTDVYYEAGTDINLAQLILDADIKLLSVVGLSSQPLLSLGTVDRDTVGVYPVTAAAVNLLGINLASVTINVHIIDTKAPVITGNDTIAYPLGANISNATFLANTNIKVTDNTDEVIIPAVDLSKVNFNVPGKYVATVTARDLSGNIATAFNVNVVIGDVIPSVITANNAISYTKGVSRTEAQFLADVHTVVTDNSGETITPTVDLSTVNFNQVGTYDVYINAKDSSNNQATPFKVTITITAPPSNLITAKTDVYYEAGTDINSAQLIIDADIKLLNIVGIASEPLLSLGTVDGNTVGVYPVTATAVNLLGLNLASVTINVHIVDTTKPVVTGSQNVHFLIGSEITLEQFILAAQIQIHDNTDEIINPIIDLSSVNFNVEGTYTVVVIARDSSGNISLPFQVTVNIGDYLSPVITGNTTVTYTKGVTRTEAEFIGDANVKVTDNSGEIITPTVDLSAVDFNTTGVYLVQVHASDSSGNNAIPFNVRINIVDVPENLITAKVDVYYEAGTNVDRSQFIVDANIAVFNVLGVSADPLVSLGTVDFDTVGVYPVTATAVSILGVHLGAVTINVHIIDTTAPSITGDSTISYEVGTSITNFQFLIDTHVSVEDNTDETINPIVDLSNVNFNVVGSYVATVSATDSSLNVSAPFAITVEIIDTIAPIVDITTTDLTYEVGTTLTEYKLIVDANITVTDNSGLQILPTVDFSSVITTEVGTYVVVVTAKDASNNSSISKTITIHIVDTMGPVITGNQSVGYEAGTTVTVNQFLLDANIVIVDNSGVVIIPTVDLSSVDFNTAGTYTVTVVATDNQGNTTTFDVSIVIGDTLIPIIDITTNEVTYEAGTILSAAQVIVDANITVSDNSGVSISPVIDLSTVNTNQVGTYTVSVTATDSSGNIATGEVIIHIIDTTNPVITGNTSVSYELGTIPTDSQFLLDANITITDNSGLSIIPTVDFSAVDFNTAGTYTATVVATDNQGNTVSFDVTIIIGDTIAPVINITTTGLTYEIGTILTSAQIILDANITVTDNSSVIILPTVDISAVNQNQVGTYLVTITAVDISGNIATAATITIHVVDTTIPVIIGNSTVHYEAGTTVTEGKLLFDANIVVTDNSGVAIIPTVDLSLVDFNIVGTYVVNVSATDNQGNNATFPVNIIITDTIAPIIKILTSTLTYEINTPVTDTQIIADANISVIDNSNETIIFGLDLTNFNADVVGTYTIEVTAADSSGNNAITGIITINIVDTIAPNITGNTSVDYEIGAIVDLNKFLLDANIIISDNSTEVITPVVDLNTVNFGLVGTYVVDVVAVDGQGNTTTFQVTINIVDTVAPIIQITTTDLIYEIGTTVTQEQLVLDANITVADNSGAVILPVIDLSTLDANQIGTYIVNVTATDDNGNTAIAGQITIHIVDTTGPSITGNTNVHYEAGTSVTATEFLLDANIEVTDNSGATIIPTVDLSLVDFNLPGTYIVTVVAEDNQGNTTTFIVSIIIDDSVAPTIQITTNTLTYEIGATLTSEQIIADAGIIVTDNSSLAITPAIDLNAVNANVVGTYTVTITAQDIAGNIAIEKTITIHIVDTIAPIITSNLSVSYEAGTNVSMLQFIADANINVTDNSGEIVIPTVDLSSIDFNTSGTYNAEVTAVDTQGNTTTLTIVVIIVDSIAPTINIETEELTYEIGTVITEEQIIGDAVVTVTDNSGLVIIPNIDLSTVNVNLVGTYVVSVTAVDAASNVAVAGSITIHIVDTTAPTITGITSLTYEIGTPIAPAQILIDANITVTDNSGETIIPIVNLSNINFNLPGSYVAVVSTVDNQGNIANFEITIIIIDTTIPVIDITRTELTYEIGTILTTTQIITDATIPVTDNSGMMIVPTVDLSLVNINQIGTYEVTVTASDATGNVAIAGSITIHIVDTTAPVITGTTNLSYEAGTELTSGQFIADANIVVTDNSGENITPTVDLSGVDFKLPGTYEVEVIAIDNQGNQATFTVTITIVDTTVPNIIITTTDLTYELGTMLTTNQVIIDAGINVTDNSSLIITPVVDISLVSTNQLGTYIVTVTAQDAANNMAIVGTITIHIVDTTAPTITGTTNLSYEAGTSLSPEQLLIDANIIVVDNSGATIIPTIDLSTVNFSIPGMYTAYVIATDNQGNTATLEITIEIVDTILPVIDIITNNLTYEIGTVLNEIEVITDANITITDNSGMTITPQIDLSAVNTNLVGTYEVTVIAKDVTNNEVTATITIHIVDTTAPIITGTPNLSYEAGTILTPEQIILNANIIVTDNSGEVITPSIDLSSIDFNTVGTYMAHVSATDSQGNVSSFEITITITDTTAPVIDITTNDLTYEIGTTLTEYQVIVDANITVTDNSGIIIIPTIDLSAVNTNQVGTYEVTVIVKDATNNEVTATITIHIVDTIAPVITGSANLTYESGITITVEQFIADANIVVTDNSGVTIIPTINLSTVNFNLPGTYQVIVGATDNQGNTSTFEVTVVISDGQTPVIDITTDDLTYEIGTVLTEVGVIEDANIVVTDDSGETITATVDISVVNANLVGTYIVTVTAKDSMNNEATATITIHIVDTIAPHITGAVSLTYEAGTIVTPVQFIETADIIVTDNSGEAITPTVDLSTVNFNAVGTYVAIVSASDSQGNTTTYEVTVVITDTTMPVIDITTSELTYEIKTVLTESQVITDANIVVTDNSGATITPTVDLGAVNINQIGTYTTTVTAKDGMNNEAIAGTITIHIVDTIHQLSQEQQT